MFGIFKPALFWFWFFLTFRSIRNIKLFFPVLLLDLSDVS